MRFHTTDMASGTKEISHSARAAFDDTQRRLIAKAACRVIDREGLSGTSLRRIAEELDCSLGLIQHHFANKEEVLVAALRAAFDQLHEDIEAAEPLSDDMSGLREGFLESLRARSPDSLYWRVVIAYRGAALSSDRLRTELREYDVDDRELIESLVATELGGADPSQVKLVADCLNAALDGIATAAVLDPGKYSLERVDQMVDGLLRGVLAANRSASKAARRRPGTQRTRAASAGRRRS